MKTFCVLNPSRNVEKWRDRIAKTGWPRAPVNRDLADGLERMIQNGLQAGVEKFVVVGGDGTFHRVVNALARANAWNTVLELVPGGTCNDFARYLYGPRYSWKPENAQQIQTIDLGKINGRYFLNNAGFGRSKAQSARSQNAVSSMFHFEPTVLSARWHAGQIQGPFWMGMACNGPFFNNGLYFSRNIQAADGVLDLFFVRPMAFPKMLKTFLLGRLGKPLVRPHQTTDPLGVSGPIVSAKAYELDLKTETPIWPQADGEPLGQETKELRIEVAKEKLRLIVP